jgi:LacI family transcriptional regulator
MAPRPTLKDVSRRAGVSTFTASNALSGKDGVAPETRKRVQSAAAEIGYVPNAVAASLKGSSSSAIGVMTASGRNQYYSMLVQAIDGVLQEEGLHAVTNDAMRGGRYDAARERESVESLLAQRVSAIVATYSLSIESLALIQSWNIPLLFVDALPPTGAELYPFVGADNFTASQQVADHLADTGHRRVVFVAYPHEWNTRQLREHGFVETAAAHGMETVVLESNNSAEGARQTIYDYLSTHREDLPDALYASNTPLLQGSLKAFQDLGIVAGTDISVVGFDDFEWADLLSPRITVVDQHIQQIGQEAGRLLTRMVSGGRADEHIAITPHLIIRDSVCTRSPRL